LREQFVRKKETEVEPYFTPLPIFSHHTITNQKCKFVGKHAQAKSKWQKILLFFHGIFSQFPICFRRSIVVKYAKMKAQFTVRSVKVLIYNYHVSANFYALIVGGATDQLNAVWRYCYCYLTNILSRRRAPISRSLIRERLLMSH